MKIERKRQVSIQAIELMDGRPIYAVIEIDSIWGDLSEKFSIECGKEINILEGKSITKEQIDIVFAAWERVLKLDFSTIDL